MAAETIISFTDGKFSWARAATAVACLIGALALIAAGHPVLCGIAGVSALGFGMAALPWPTAHVTCPNCGGQTGLGQSPIPCSSCGQYAWQEGNRLIAVEPDYVAARPTFSVHLDQLVAGGRLSNCSWPWPGRCCVCGRPAVRAERLKLQISSPGPVSTSLIFNFDIPHCSSDTKGVIEDFPNLRLQFRSYRYLREFCAANRIALKDAPRER